MRRATRPEHRVLGVHAVGEEERQVGREVVDVHAAREVGLDVGEAVGEREGELADRVRAGLGDVVAGDRHRVEVAHLVVDELLLDVAHHPAARTRWRRCRCSGPGPPSGCRPARCRARSTASGPDLGGLLVVGSRPFSARNASSCWSMAVLRNIARIVGAGPLIVIDTEVVGSHRSKPDVEHLHVVERGDRHAGVADLAVDVGALVGVDAVQRDRVERGRQALSRAGPPTAAGSAGWCGTRRPRRRTCGSGPRPRA